MRNPAKPHHEPGMARDHPSTTGYVGMINLVVMVCSRTYVFHMTPAAEIHSNHFTFL